MHKRPVHCCVFSALFCASAQNRLNWSFSAFWNISKWGKKKQPQHDEEKRDELWRGFEHISHFLLSAQLFSIIIQI